MNRICTAWVLTFALCCSLAACMTTKSPEQRQADKELVEQVQATLTSDKNLYSRHIVVRADGGVVTLAGYVWTPEEMSAAVQIAEGVSGVSKVVNRMEIDRGDVQDSGVTR
jgi:hyperosmotically inducible periplasmic protein